MAISIYEFKTAMEELKAEYAGMTVGTRTQGPVPAYCVDGVIFLHSGSYYVVLRGRGVNPDAMNFAMEKLGEGYPGDKHFWYGEVHTVKGLITLVLFINNSYSDEQVNALMIKTYRRMLKEARESYVDPALLSGGNLLPGFEKLRDTTKIFDDCAAFLMREYDDVTLEKLLNVSELSISVKDQFTYAEAKFLVGEQKVTVALKELAGKPDFYYMLDMDGVWVRHYYAVSNKRDYDEVLYIGTFPKDESKKIDLRVSFCSGLIWSTYAEDDAKKATKTDIDKMNKLLEQFTNQIKLQIS